MRVPAKYSEADVERFWANVHKTANCWFWIGYRSRSYGAFYVGGERNVGAHIFSWVLHNGAIPEGQQILHRCDIPQCVNPAHLILGTQSENIKDSIEKGSHANLFKAETRTNCKAGHNMSVVGYYRSMNGYRACKECKRETNRQSKNRKVVYA